MLTARTERSDRIAGLDAGADDYLPKPFGPEELVSRIRAVLRRCGLQPERTLQLSAGHLRVNCVNRQAWNRDTLLDLTAVEFEIMQHLVQAHGRVVSRDELSIVLNRRESDPFERSLDVHISHLRRKLQDDEHSIIQTIRGAGYTLSGGGNG
jgi:two-component system response regulator CpxR